MTDVPGPLASALGDRYHLERELGAGGMATVYLATDERHHRKVAIKILRPELAAVLGAERFVREIQTTANLRHPHILPLYDSGEAAGFLFYVMPLVEGESLRDRLTREKQLSLDDALRIAREVADALSYAHARGVIHRDIKPENILLESGHAVVADFGIAKALRAAGGETLTRTGLSIGTPTYMSPEQAAGEQDLDGRSDLYALACVLYEMLAGQPPFTGATVEALVRQHLTVNPPPITSHRPAVPAAVAAALQRALAKTPADRFNPVAQFSEALRLGEGTFSPPAMAGPGLPRRFIRRATAAAAGIVLLGAGYLLWSHRPAVGEPGRSIAVLPFTNVGGDPTNEPFSDGVADELTTALGQVDGLSVAARTSAFSFKGKGLDAREIGRQLQVRYIVEGKVWRTANRLRARAELIDVARDKEVWSGQFEPDPRNHDVFALQDSITQSIMRELRVTLSAGASASLAKRGTGSEEAHNLYLQGRYFFAKRDSASLRKAQDFFEQAIQQDSSYALAYAGLSDSYSHRSVFGFVAPRDIFPKAKAAAARALALNSGLAEVHTSLGFIALFYDWDWQAAGRELDRALAIDPRYPDAHLFHAWYFVAINRLNDAVEEGRTAVRLDPFSPVANGRLVDFLYFARRYDEALAQALRVLERDPTGPVARNEAGRAYAGLGQCAESVAQFERAGPGPFPTTMQGELGYVYARCGHREQALSELAGLRAQALRGQYVSHFGLAKIQAGLGDKDRAFAELDSAYTERAWGMFGLKVDPAFDSLRADPRFAHLVRKLGLGS